MSKIGHFFILVCLLVGCGGQKVAEKPTSPRIVKKTKVVSPTRNQKFKIGDSIPFEIKAGSSIQIDSIVVDIDGNMTTHTELTFSRAYQKTKVGTVKPKVTTYFGGESETHYPKVIFLAAKAPEEYTYEVINSFAHDTDDYTQGLLIHQGFLYESSGQHGKSTLEKKQLTSGETIQQINLSDDFFGEGLAIVNDQLYQLTYTSGACFVYNLNFEKINSFSYDGQGWGLCEYKGNLLMTNSTEKIQVRNPATFSIIDEWEVFDDQGKVGYINELEMINGLIYSNVYQEDYIVVIDPETHTVVKKIDMSGLLTDGESSRADVLNGIAYDSSSDRIFVTGKLWPKLFEVKFIPKQEVQ